jgi:lysophospholipase L1-like esterase
MVSQLHISPAARARRTLLGLLGLTSLLFAILPGVHAQEGPAPYPSKTDEAAWPGQGPIRVFDWMTTNREHFWTRREKDQGAVVFAGSSMMGNWKNVAAAFPHLKVANRGIGGDVSRGLLFRFKEDVLDLNPRAVVIAIGSNDLSAHTNPEVVAENVAAIIDLARAHKPGIPIVLCPVAPRENPQSPLKPGALEDYNALITSLGVTKKVAVPDLRTPFVTPDGKQIPVYFGKDRMHLSSAGYEKLAVVIGAELKKLGIE